MRPEIKILACSNVYSRMMLFKQAGDQEQGHKHDYNHGTLLSKGRLLVQKLDDSGAITSSKVFTAPSFIFVEKDVKHLLTAVEDDTVAVCIHALRDVDQEIIDPSTFVEGTLLADSRQQAIETGLKGIGQTLHEKGITYSLIAKS